MGIGFVVSFWECIPQPNKQIDTLLEYHKMSRAKIGLGDIQSLLGKPPSFTSTPSSQDNASQSTAQAVSATSSGQGDGATSALPEQQQNSRGRGFLTSMSDSAAKSASALTTQNKQPHTTHKKAASSSLSQKHQQPGRSVRIQDPGSEQGPASNKKQPSSQTPRSNRHMYALRGHDNVTQGSHNRTTNQHQPQSEAAKSSLNKQGGSSKSFAPGNYKQNGPVTFQFQQQQSSKLRSGPGAASNNKFECELKDDQQHAVVDEEVTPQGNWSEDGSLQQDDLWQEEQPSPQSNSQMRYAHPQGKTPKSDGKSSFVNWNAHARSVSPMKSHSELARNSSVRSDNSSEITDSYPVRINTSTTQQPPYASRKRRVVNYKPKTMQEYRQQQLKYNSSDGSTPWQQLGSLGADLENEEVKRKREKTKRMHEYGKTLSIENQKKIDKTGRRPPPIEEEAQIRQQRRNELSKFRERAVEFAQQLPRPKIKPSTKSSHSTTSQGSTKKSKSTYDLDNELEMLLQTHDELRKEVNSFRHAVLDEQDGS
eukprot:gb/GECG01013470.1/.p1 GENE.gb/GECG01013470.1/~~gb/GECG01013470.1/.p1  ORF type:complete len:537 (+),score=85.73 gb/GECG01013470.1/:1-1611(+)